MNNPSRRGAVIFVAMLVFAWFFCGVLPTSIMPNNGIAMALPVIQVPGEVFIENWPSPDFELTNTLVGMLLADAIVLLIVFYKYTIVSQIWRL